MDLPVYESKSTIEEILRADGAIPYKRQPCQEGNWQTVDCLCSTECNYVIVHVPLENGIRTGVFTPNDTKMCSVCTKKQAKIPEGSYKMFLLRHGAYEREVFWLGVGLDTIRRLENVDPRLKTLGDTVDAYRLGLV